MQTTKKDMKMACAFLGLFCGITACGYLCLSPSIEMFFSDFTNFQKA